MRIEHVLDELRAGRFVVVVGRRQDGPEGHLVIAAQHVTRDAVNFMAKEGRGVVSVSLTPERCDALGLQPMTTRAENIYGSAVAVSIEAREGVTTGISAADRARTIQVAIDPASTPHDLVEPGHVFPLRARPGGVLERAGRTEAAVDLARLAGLLPAAAVCEILDEEGSLAGSDYVDAFCERHGLAQVSADDVVRHRWQTERLVEREASVRLPTAYGDFTAVAYRETLTGSSHVALVRGDVAGAGDVLVRVHSECVTGDVFHSLRCDCGRELRRALSRLAAEERGVLLYLTRKGRALELLDVEEEVEPEVSFGAPARAPGYGVGAQILADLGLTGIRVLTNNPRPIEGIGGFGLEVVEQVPLGL